MKKLFIKSAEKTINQRILKIVDMSVTLATTSLITHTIMVGTALGADAKWKGVDETVVERYAEKAGRSSWTPFINTDQGDLLLFIFLIAGVAGGFVIGYYWRVLFKDGKK